MFDVALAGVLPTADRLVDTDTPSALRAQAQRRRARALCAWLVARRLGCDPRRVVLADGRDGAPSVTWPPNELSISWTHTHAAAAAAVGPAGGLGIDLECLSRPKLTARKASRLARRYFAAPLSAHLQAVPARARVRHFLTLWTLWEATAKSRGLGLARARPFAIDALCVSDALQTLPVWWSMADAAAAVGHARRLATAIRRRVLGRPYVLALSAPRHGSLRLFARTS